MELPQRIVAGSDGSPTARRAVEVAAVLALACDAPLVVVAVWQPTEGRRSARATRDDTDWQGERAWAEQVATDAAAVARHAGVATVSTATPVGAPGKAIVEFAGEVPGTLVVVGTVGLDSTQRRLGTIPHHLTHKAPGDLLLVRPGDGPVADWDEVVLTTDGSDTSVRAARTGLAVARALALPPVLVSAGDDRDALLATLEEVAARIDDGGSMTLEPAVGDGVSDLLEVAAEDRGLLVLGNHGMRGLGRLQRSVPDDLVHRLPADVLLVHTSR